MKDKKYKNKEWLYDEYINKRKSTIEISKECCCSTATVWEHLKKFNIPRRSFQESKNVNLNIALLNNKDWLEEQYLIKKLTSGQIAKICRCDRHTIIMKLKAFGIKRRKGGEANNPNIKLDLLTNKNWLYKKYYEENHTIAEIAKLCNCSISTAGLYFNINGLQTKDIIEIKGKDINYNILNNNKKLEELYIKKNKSSNQIAIICNCDASTVLDYLHKHNIPIRVNKGENHPFWKGGISFEPYCQEFNPKRKEKVRNEFNRVCFLCGKSEEENGKKLCVHHVDYNKGQGCGQGWSLIPLCSICHNKTNHNRHFWFNLLQNYWLIDDTKNFYAPIILITQIF